jgi:hypothetical protein
MACDVYFDDSEEEHYLYIAEYTHSLEVISGSPKVFVHRTGRLRIDETATAFGDIWEEDALGTGVPARGPNASPLTRFLDVADYDDDGNEEGYFLAEAGAVMVEDEESIRQFCTRAQEVGRPAGGYVCEVVSSSSYPFTYARVGGFTVPRNDTDMYGVNLGLYDNGLTGPDWWNPTVGSNRWDGQVDFDTWSFTKIGAGASMTVANLLKGQGGTMAPSIIVPHLVVGTRQGYVYALEIGDRTGGLTDASIRYASPDLGWYVIGMDAADLDDDGEDEVVVGNWVDCGTFDDWLDVPSVSLERNRGLLMILETSTETVDDVKTFEVAEVLTGDELVDSGCQALGSGVFGVKIDDVDGDGDFEIWAGDAMGSLYLFGQDSTGDWVGMFRTDVLGTYPGYYNNIYPIKADPADEHSATEKVVVVSSGYVMAFDVDCSELDGPDLLDCSP